MIVNSPAIGHLRPAIPFWKGGFLNPTKRELEFDVEGLATAGENALRIILHNFLFRKCFSWTINDFRIKRPAIVANFDLRLNVNT